MKPYPAYKDSGIEWIGEIPNGWTIQKLKHFSSVNLSNVDKKSQDGQPRVRLCNYTDVYYNEFITSNLNFMEATATPEQIEKFTLKKGDVLITKDSEEWDDIAVPAYVAMNYEDVLCGYHLAHIRPCEEFIDGRYLMRSFNAYPLYVQFKVSANGITRYGIGKYDIENALFILPTTNEQKAIADFLDKKTALIDGLIEKKKRQIELLKEQRQAVINQAITKGLDPTVEMKDSGIEWIGKIPKHWKPIRFKYLFSEIYRYPTYYGIEYEPDGILEIRGLMLKVGAIIDYENEPRFISKKTSDKYPRTQLKTGDIVMSVRGTIGKIGLVPKEIEGSNITANLMRLSPICEIANSEYLSILLETYYFQNILEVASDQTTIKTITVPDLVCSFLSIPPLTEQKDIVLYLKEQINETDKLIKKAEKQIELLQEYRTALISEAVTGKIDVRNAV